MSKKKARSPCVDICRLDKATGLCIGCLRTKSEIKSWKDLSKSERRVVIAALPGRRVEPDIQIGAKPAKQM